MICKELKWYSIRSANVHWNHKTKKTFIVLYMYIFVKKTETKVVDRIITLRYTCQSLT